MSARREAPATSSRRALGNPFHDRRAASVARPANLTDREFLHRRRRPQIGPARARRRCATWAARRVAGAHRPRSRSRSSSTDFAPAPSPLCLTAALDLVLLSRHRRRLLIAAGTAPPGLSCLSFALVSSFYSLLCLLVWFSTPGARSVGGVENQNDHIRPGFMGVHSGHGIRGQIHGPVRTLRRP